MLACNDLIIVLRMIPGLKEPVSNLNDITKKYRAKTAQDQPLACFKLLGRAKRVGVIKASVDCPRLPNGPERPLSQSWRHQAAGE